jgi:hypothetical protein
MNILNKIIESVKSNFNTLVEGFQSPIFIGILSYISLLVAYSIESILFLLISIGLAGYTIYLTFKD